jgi:hypothetical protein
MFVLSVLFNVRPQVSDSDSGCGWTLSVFLLFSVSRQAGRQGYLAAFGGYGAVAQQAVYFSLQ